MTWRAAGFMVVMLGLAAGCGLLAQSWRVGNLRCTLYTMPRPLTAGQGQVGIRIQDRDYRILSPGGVVMHWAAESGGQSGDVALAPGPGRDFRGRPGFPAAGWYQVEFTIHFSGEPDVITRQRLHVAAQN